MQAATPRSVSTRSSSRAAQRAGTEAATASVGSTTMATPGVLPLTTRSPAAAPAAAPVATRRNRRRLRFAFTVSPPSPQLQSANSKPERVVTVLCLGELDVEPVGIGRERQRACPKQVD